MEIYYPKQHKKIVSDLLGGKFILQKNELFDTITQNNKEFYTCFFDESFGYDLKITNEYICLISLESNEKLSKNITLFLAILCYELDREGKNFSSEIKTSYFDIEEVKEKLLASEYKEVILNIDEIANLHKLVQQMTDRNITERKSENRFAFTPAVEIFFRFAEEYLKQNDVEKINIS